MMPEKDHYGAWPLSGEIDILEGVNLGATCTGCEGTVGENRMISALHFGDFAPANKVLDTRVALPSKALPSDDFHIWTLEWAEGKGKPAAVVYIRDAVGKSIASEVVTKQLFNLTRAETALAMELAEALMAVA